MSVSCAWRLLVSNAEVSLVLDFGFQRGVTSPAQDAEGISAHQVAVVHKRPVADFVGIHGDALAEFQAFDVPGGVVHQAVKTISAEGDIREPDVLFVVTLYEWLLDLKIVLRGRGMLKRGYECTHCLPCLPDGAFHLLILVGHRKVRRLYALLLHLPGNGMPAGVRGLLRCAAAEGKKRDYIKKMEFHSSHLSIASALTLDSDVSSPDYFAGSECRISTAALSLQGPLE